MAILKTLIVKGVARFLTDAYMSTIRSGIWNGSTIQVGYGGTGVTSAVGDLYTPVFLSSSGITPCTVAIPHNTKDFKINGTTYSIFTTYTGTAPTIFAPTTLAGTGGYILATNSAKNGLEWVAKPAANVTTSAVVSSSASGTTLITAAQTDPYYNLLEGGSVTRSIQFKHGDDLSISASTGGVITYSLPNRLKPSSTQTSLDSVPSNGFYFTNTGTLPEGVSDGHFIATKSPSGYAFELLFKSAGNLTTNTNYDASDLFLREYNGSTSTWSNWVTILTSFNLKRFVSQSDTPVVLSAFNTTYTIATIGGVDIKIKTPANPNTNTWRGIYTSGTSRVGTATSTKAMNFASSNLTISYLAAGTSSGQSGSADYFTIGIEAKDWSGATSEANGTAGYMPAPAIANMYSFLRGDGTWVNRSMQAIPYIVGPSTDTTAGTWTGTCSELPSIEDGTTIIYVPAVAGASTTTLNINGTGAKTCYYTNSSKLTTHFSVGTPIMFTYVGGAWKRADYDSNSNTWRNIYTSNTSRVGTANSTKAMNFVGTGNISIGFKAAGTGADQSGNANYFTISIDAAANAVDVAGYVAAPTAADNKHNVWMTNASGEPAWRAVTVPASVPTIGTSSTTIATIGGIDIKAQISSSTFDGRYVKLVDTEQTIESTISSYSKGIIEFYRSSGNHIAFIQFANKDNNGNKQVLGAIGFHSGNPGQLEYRTAGAVYYAIAHAGNISNKAATIGTSLTTIATIAGINITAKIGSYLPSNHVYSLSIAADSGTNQLTLAASTKYKLTAGGSTFIFTTPDNGVRSVTINGNYLRVNTNGTNADLTIPYATATSVLNSTLISTDADITETGVRAYTGIGTSWEGSITSMAYAAMLTFGSPSRGWQMWAQRATALGMYWRRGNSDASAWEDPRLFLDNVNTTAAVSGNTLTLTIGGSATTYTPSLANLVVQIFNSTKTLKVSEWTTIAAVNTYDAGTYALLISSGTTLYASGVFSLCKNNDAINDEIPLHVSSTSNAWRPYARISGNNLLMSSTEATGTSRSYTVKIFKLI